MVKAISPLVATVLLIGVTMATSALLAIWAIGFFQAKLPTTEKNVCEGIDVSIDDCRVIGNKISLKLFNYLNNPLTNLTAQLENATYTGSVQNLGDIQPGEKKSFTIDTDVDNFSKLTISSKVCPQLKKETSCK
ncbi:MAG: hypothetical protein QXG91_03415 [Candidatus Aenigmatarchaeota archaeon]